MNELTTDIDFVVIVRRDRQRHRPNETILEIGCYRSTDLLGPYFDVARLPGLDVVNFDNTADAA